LKAASQKLNVHPTTLRRWADNGDIPIMLTPGGHRRFLAADIEQFAQNRHGLRRVSGIEQVWADRALTATRQELSRPNNLPWLEAIDEESRQRSRVVGRQLMALTLQYISNDDDAQLLDEAHKIGMEYGVNCQQMGMPLRDALQASMFFRDTMIETAMTLPENVNIRPEANMRLLRRINTLLNTVHLAVAEVYDGSNNDIVRGA
jgi:excisionase family DNA binding protein